jgi:biopolymer transport protein ExbB/TolQ
MSLKLIAQAGPPTPLLAQIPQETAQTDPSQQNFNADSESLETGGSENSGPGASNPMTGPGGLLPPISESTSVPPKGVSASQEQPRDEGMVPSEMDLSTAGSGTSESLVPSGAVAQPSEQPSGDPSDKTDFNNATPRLLNTDNTTSPRGNEVRSPDQPPIVSGGEDPPTVQDPSLPSLTAGGSQDLPTGESVSTPPESDMSIKDMFQGAEPIVQGVMLLLLLASLATWMVIFEKIFVLWWAKNIMNRFKKIAIDQGNEIEIEQFPQMTVSIVKAGVAESQDSVGSESRADYRERMEKAMKTVLATIMRRLGKRSTLLATVGAVSPFVGLFGTVWGIMHSFIGIASSGETTLAVVAPGIAEALFATAMGLVAAIPAVIGYNKITGSIKDISLEGVTAVSLIGNHLARFHYGQLEKEEVKNGQ